MTNENVELLSVADRYAVVGNPISHSKSPIIHEAFARQTNQNISYERILAPLNAFDKTIHDLFKQGYKGVNVTVPFKFEAFMCSQSHTLWSNAARAANTLIFSDKITGENTDGLGLVNDIRKNLGVIFTGKRLLVLGAGGAASGVMLSLLLEAPSLLTIANRTLEKAVVLQQHLELFTQSEGMEDCNKLAATIRTADFSGLNTQEFDIVINATSVGLSDTALPIPNTIFAKNCLAYDMMYGRETPFMQQARENDALVADGLGMLVEQAAEAFYIWRGVRPETKSVMQYVRDLSK